MFLITNGDTNNLTKAIVVERERDIDAAVVEFATKTKTPINEVVVNKVGERVD